MADLNFQSSLFLSNYMFNFKTFNFVHQKTAIVKELHSTYFLLYCTKLVQKFDEF